MLDENTTVVEGVLDLPRTIVIQLASRDEALDWYNSAAYRAVRPLRLEATEGFAVLVDGFSSAAPPADDPVPESHTPPRSSSRKRYP